LNYKAKHIIFAVATVVLFASCKPQVPSQYIQPDDMEDLIYDYHLAQGIASQQSGNEDYNRRLTFEMVLKEHGVTQAEFDSSLVYYYTRADRFQEIYKHVQNRLNEEAEKYGGAINELQNITGGSMNGDTTDIWTGQRSLMLLNDRPYHLYSFRQYADSTIHAGDSFLMSMSTTWLMQNGNTQATAYVAITYENDSTTRQYTTITTSGNSMLNIPACKERVKEIKGFVMCGMRPTTDRTNNLCLLFINNIQLIRFHHQDLAVPASTQLPANSGVILKPDSMKVDTTRRPLRRIAPRQLNVGDVRASHIEKK
jgi:hypothetical protein